MIIAMMTEADRVARAVAAKAVTARVRAVADQAGRAAMTTVVMRMVAKKAAKRAAAAAMVRAARTTQPKDKGHRPVKGAAPEADSRLGLLKVSPRSNLGV